MSDQVFLQAHISGIEPFLQSANDEAALLGRAQYAMLLNEVLPRALLQEFGLARILLGASGGGEFLLLLPGEDRDRANEFLNSADADLRRLTGNHVCLQWVSTENLGNWTDIRKRLQDLRHRQGGTPATAGQIHELFAPFAPADASAIDDGYFASLGPQLRTARQAGWTAEAPARVLIGEGKHTFPLEELGIAVHIAPDDAEAAPASAATIASRAKGRPAWGILRGRVDDYATRVRRAQNIDEHLAAAMLYKQFLAGELTLASAMGDHWRRVTLLYTGREEFVAMGSWDALISLAREVQKTFQRLAEETLRESPGPEGKTMTMAIALAAETEASPASVYEQARQDLCAANATDKDCLWLFGRVLEWKQLPSAVELKDDLVRLVTESGRAAEVLRELIHFYREPPVLPGFQRRGNRLERPWRFHRQLSLVFGEARHRGQRKFRTSVVTDLIGKNAAQARLRPAGRVALEWAMMEES